MNVNCEYLVIGSGVAGHSAYKRLKEIAPEKATLIITDDHDYPYDRPPLSKEYLRGEVGEPFFEPAESYGKSILLGRHVTKITDGTALLDDGSEIHFSKALISTGVRPRKLGVPNEWVSGVHYLRTLRDCNSFKHDAVRSSSPVIVGAGFIGVEVAASLRKLGLNPTVLEATGKVWGKFLDERTSIVVQKYLEARGIRFMLNETVSEFIGSSRLEGLQLKGGGSIDADVALVAVGTEPNAELAMDSKIPVSNGIVVNERLETELDGVYAAGDVANIYVPQLGKRVRIEHWNNADYTGRLAAENMTGKGGEYAFVSTIWSDVLDLHIESAGDIQGYDETLIRGRLNDMNFAVLFLSKGVLLGYIAINRKFEELSALNSLIMKDVGGLRKRLEDESVEL